jgi:inner membrane protein involved in colicin E2 resistance
MRTLLVIIICVLLLLSLVIVASVISVREKYKEKIIAEIIEYEEYATDAYGKQFNCICMVKKQSG